MEWSSDVMLQLIYAYRDRPELWDPAHKFYRLNNRKNEAWLEIAATLNSDVLQVKRKINSLLASYRRERHKVRLGETGQLNGRKGYRSAWFAFDSFSFLYEIHRERWKPETGENVTNFIPQIEQLDQESFIEAEELIQNDQNIKIEAVEPNPLDEENTEEEISANEEPEETYQITKKSKPQRRVRFKAKSVTDDSTLIKALKMLQKVAPAAKQRDESDVYGEYIASKLRKFDDRTRSIVQHAINNILFDAEMGKYNNNQYVYNSQGGFSSQDSQVCSTQFQQTNFPSSSNQQM